MIMYGVYNVDTFKKLIQMVHKMNNRSVCMKDYMQDMLINDFRCIRSVKVQIIMPYICYYIYELYKKNI